MSTAGAPLYKQIAPLFMANNGRFRPSSIHPESCDYCSREGHLVNHCEMLREQCRMRRFTRDETHALIHWVRQKSTGRKSKSVPIGHYPFSSANAPLSSTYPSLPIGAGVQGGRQQAQSVPPQFAFTRQTAAAPGASASSSSPAAPSCTPQRASRPAAGPHEAPRCAHVCEEEVDERALHMAPAAAHNWSQVDDAVGSVMIEPVYTRYEYYGEGEVEEVEYDRDESQCHVVTTAECMCVESLETDLCVDTSECAECTVSDDGENDFCSDEFLQYKSHYLAVIREQCFKTVLTGIRTEEGIVDVKPMCFQDHERALLPQHLTAIDLPQFWSKMDVSERSLFEFGFRRELPLSMFVPARFVSVFLDSAAGACYDREGKPLAALQVNSLVVESMRCVFGPNVTPSVMSHVSTSAVVTTAGASVSSETTAVTAPAAAVVSEDTNVAGVAISIIIKIEPAEKKEEGKLPNTPASCISQFSLDALTLELQVALIEDSTGKALSMPVFQPPFNLSETVRGDGRVGCLDRGQPRAYSGQLGDGKEGTIMGESISSADLVEEIAQVVDTAMGVSADVLAERMQKLASKVRGKESEVRLCDYCKAPGHLAKACAKLTEHCAELNFSCQDTQAFILAVRRGQVSNVGMGKESEVMLCDYCKAPGHLAKACAKLTEHCAELNFSRQDTQAFILAVRRGQVAKATSVRASADRHTDTRKKAPIKAVGKVMRK